MPTLEKVTAAPEPVRSPAVPEPARWRRWLPAAGPGLLMLLLGLLGCTRAVLSWDEIATADVARRSAGQIWQLAHHVDGVFYPYYLAMHGWTALFGDSVLSLRLPSILAMAGAAAVTGELGRRRLGGTTGLVAGLLVALVPNMTRYAAEARPYAWAALMTVLALLLLDRVLERPSAARWLAYAAAVLGIGLSSIIALTALAGHAALLMIRRRRSAFWPWSAAVAGPLLLLTPLIWWGLHQHQAQLYWVPPMTLGGVYTFPQYLTGAAEVGWLLIGFLLLAAYRVSRPVAEMAAAAGLPLAVVGAVSFAGTSFWINRYLLFTLLPMMIVAAAGLTAARRTPDVPAAGRVAGWRSLAPLALALAVFAAAAWPGQLAFRKPTFKNGSDYRTLAAVIMREQQPGDEIVLEKGRTLRAGLDYYLRHDAGRPLDVLMREPASVTATLNAAEYPDPTVRLAAASRIWLVAYGRRSDPGTARPDLRPLLAGGFRRIGVWEVKNGSMALYVRRP